MLEAIRSTGECEKSILCLVMKLEGLRKAETCLK